jgi:hypothetical protein
MYRRFDELSERDLLAERSVPDPDGHHRTATPPTSTRSSSPSITTGSTSLSASGIALPTDSRRSWRNWTMAATILQSVPWG